MLLALLANFHKSEAAKLNPYLKCMRETQDERLMRKICWASNFATDAVVKYALTACTVCISTDSKTERTKTYLTTPHPR